MNQYEETAKYLKLKNFLSAISDISYAYGELKTIARTNNTPLSMQISQFEELAKRAEMLITLEGKNHE